MKTIVERARAAGLALAAAVIALGLAVSLAAPPAEAQQVNPTAMSVEEEALLNALQRGEAVGGRVTIPDPRAGTLINPEGRDWTAMATGTMFQITAWTLVGMLVLLAVFYLARGRVTLESGWSGRKILRFNAVERFAHWLTAVSFIVLALTGLNFVLGRALLLPLIGEGAFGTLSAWAKLVHNYVAWPFMIGLALVLVLWIKDNIPSRVDGQWLRQAGGFFKRGVHPPAHRFNAGQKLIFWAVVIGGVALSWTGVLLLFPELTATTGGWQLAQTIHGIAAAIMTAIILAHIYIGTLGMEGAYEAMGSGEVDLNWAREHHSLWVEEKLGAGEARKADAPANQPVAPAE